MRIVLDTNVLIRALRNSQGASQEIVAAIGHGEITALATESIFKEYESVLKRPEHLLATGLTMDQLDTFLDTLASQLANIRLFFTWRPLSNDPGDDAILEAAINGQADAIVTFNLRHLQIATQFGIEVLQPAEFVRRFLS